MTVLDTIPALSVSPPWAHAVCHFGQRIVNHPKWTDTTRALNAARRLMGSTTLIYAAKECTRKEYEYAESWMNGAGITTRLIGGHGLGADLGRATPELPRMPFLSDLQRGALVARATLADVVRTTVGGHRHHLGPVQDCMLCAFHRPSDAERCPQRDPWAMIGFGIVLADVVPLAAPVSYAGRGEWFKVPPRVVS